MVIPNLECLRVLTTDCVVRRITDIRLNIGQYLLIFKFDRCPLFLLTKWKIFFNGVGKVSPCKSGFGLMTLNMTWTTGKDNVVFLLLFFDWHCVFIQYLETITDSVRYIGQPKRVIWKLLKCLSREALV